MKDPRSKRFESRVECMCFFDKLAELLKPHGYRIVESCNKSSVFPSMYLIPEGTESELSYYGKPILSFRLSEHWNWYSSLKKCEDPWRIQCFNRDIPWARKRKSPTSASEPLFGWQVAFYGPDKEYHHVFGSKFDRKTRTWSFERTKAEDIVKMLFGDEYLWEKTSA